MDDYVYVWPCGAWCQGDDLEEFLSFKSDDYETLTWEEFSEQYPGEFE